MARGSEDCGSWKFEVDDVELVTPEEGMLRGSRFGGGAPLTSWSSLASDILAGGFGEGYERRQCGAILLSWLNSIEGNITSLRYYRAGRFISRRKRHLRESNLSCNSNHGAGLYLAAPKLRPPSRPVPRPRLRLAADKKRTAYDRLQKGGHLLTYSNCYF